MNFATTDTIASAGNMSGLNRAWKTQGPDKGAAKVRESIEYLLYGPESLRLEDRLTQLIEGKKGRRLPVVQQGRCSPRCSASSSPTASCRC